MLRTAQQARRSLTWLEDIVGSRPLPAVVEPSAFDFVEVRAEDTGEVDVLLSQLGFTFRGRHRSKERAPLGRGAGPDRVQ